MTQSNSVAEPLYRIHIRRRRRKDDADFEGCTTKADNIVLERDALGKIAETARIVPPRTTADPLATIDAKSFTYADSEVIREQSEDGSTSQHTGDLGGGLVSSREDAGSASQYPTTTTPP